MQDMAACKVTIDRARRPSLQTTGPSQAPRIDASSMPLRRASKPPRQKSNLKGAEKRKVAWSHPQQIVLKIQGTGKKGREPDVPVPAKSFQYPSFYAVV